MFFGRKFSGYHRGVLSGLDILVLSMIKNKSEISGYDIIQKLNNQFKGMWTTSAGTIYPMLNRLEHNKLIISRESMDSKRQKKIYNITEEGIDELKTVLDDNLEPSFHTLGDFIKTIFKASMPSEETMVRMIGHFPFPEFPHDYEIDKTSNSLENIERIKRILNHLERGKQKIEMRLNGIEKKIVTYKDLLEKIMAERKNAKTIEIIDDEEEFENF